MFNLKQGKKVHLIGIGGISMSAIANILLAQGYKVSGSDDTDNNRLRDLHKKGARINIGLSARNIKNPDYVIYTAAISKTNCELEAAVARGVPVVERKVFLGELVKWYKTPIAVTGTHGKTTTTAMLASVFIDCGYDPTVLVGGEFEKIGGNYKIGGTDYLIFEADEYVDTFLCFYPQAAVMLNIELDHPDYFKNIQQLRDSFLKFSGNVKQNGFVVINADDDNIAQISPEISADKTTYGEKGEYRAANIIYNDLGQPSFDVTHNDETVTHIDMKVIGKHSVYSALSVVAVAQRFGISASDAATSISNFTGVARRFSYMGERDGVRYYDDYAHHPTAVSATLKAVSRIPHNNIWVIFQPHTFSRTAALKSEFAQQLSKADKVVVTDIYSARETNRNDVHATMIAGDITSEVVYIKHFEDIVRYVRGKAEPNDIVITIGAGNISEIHSGIFNA